ncbi:uncharacterized protein DNG_05062 [Cephalotrichum gorgonifer]|uniref:Uncharacterized protein n=1 Tax=Cephalotrichum gorgonifer TaxID=2041049 RepID=A0AAE8MZ27_9PEZI|nr:uncharacterized protein DNG_05062 [Cephalotrichum gorgonifer]
MDDRCIPRKVKPRIGCSIVHTDATRIEHVDPDEHDYPDVLILTIRRTLLDSILLAIISVLPWPLVILARALFPGIFLPQRFIMKKQKDSREDEFEYEKSMYDMLSDLQGHQIPICYGEGRYEGLARYSYHM